MIDKILNYITVEPLIGIVIGFVLGWLWAMGTKITRWIVAIIILIFIGLFGYKTYLSKQPVTNELISKIAVTKDEGKPTDVKKQKIQKKKE